MSPLRARFDRFGSRLLSKWLDEPQGEDYVRALSEPIPFASAIIRKELGLESNLYQILQIVSVTLFEKVPILQAFQASESQSDLTHSGNQLILSDF